MNVSAAPDVLEYASISEFLKAFYQFKKSQDSGFSYSKWATETGIRGKSLLQAMVEGHRNVSERSTHLIQSKLRLDAPRSRHFQHLAMLARNKDQGSKKQVEQEVVSRRRLKASTAEIACFEKFLSSQLAPKILVLISFTDIETSAKNLASILGANQSEIQVALLLLEELKLAQKKTNEEPIQWKALFENFKVPYKRGAPPLKTHQRKNLEAAIQAVEAISPERPAAQNGYFHTLLLPANEAEFDEIAVEMQAFIETLRTKYSSDQFQGRRLYQFNMSVFGVDSST